MPRNTSSRRPPVRRQEEKIDGEAIWVRISDRRGQATYVQTRVLSWGTAADGVNFGRPLVHIHGDFSFYARKWRRVAPNTCNCRVCEFAKRRGQPPVHGISGND